MLPAEPIALSRPVITPRAEVVGQPVTAVMLQPVTAVMLQPVTGGMLWWSAALVSWHCQAH
jgi:hypothetical protein